MAVSDKFICLDPRDNVVVARVAVGAGETMQCGDVTIPVSEHIGPGHKMAVREIAAGDDIVKYGQPIGTAGQAIAPGQWVHVHNVVATRSQQDYQYCTDIRIPPAPSAARTFRGYRRP
ncbi:MAG: UxaA family hydrolase, partial [Planctomycetaceae bacterium]|nr:UxaA family hydrolase [Planctomycetaceae bacterium]